MSSNGTMGTPKPRKMEVLNPQYMGEITPKNEVLSSMVLSKWIQRTHTVPGDSSRDPT